jgi:hypothetical protein
MKNFLTYLSEVQKTYEFRIKIANCDPKDKLAGLKIGLAEYAVESISDAKRLPIKSNDIDFPNIPNCEVFLMDAVLKYPVNDAKLRTLVATHLDCSLSQVVVVPANHPEEQRRWDLQGNDIKEFKQGEAVLDKPFPEADADQKAASKFYSEAGTILKEFNKTAKFEIAGSDTTIGGDKDPSYGKTTNDLPQGKVDPVGSKQNAIPNPNKKLG